MGAMISNANAKRMALSVVIFNVVTAFIVTITLFYFIDIVDFLSVYIGISENDYAMKLSLFHTVFNLAGLIIFSFFTILAIFLVSTFE